ncbi:MAG: hypothetical protein ABR500_07790 [Dermatophilaceae bacterium]|nr:hypothetical protein [Intrasporangiaceae bacterium]
MTIGVAVRCDRLPERTLIEVPIGVGTAERPTGLVMSALSHLGGPAVVVDPTIEADPTAPPSASPATSTPRRLGSARPGVHGFRPVRPLGRPERHGQRGPHLGGPQRLLPQSGHYGPRQPVSDEADGTARLMAFIGRDPAWQPPATS